VNLEELEALMTKIGALIAPYRTSEQAVKPGRKMHSLAIVITPPKEGGAQ
jgi:hypothetical protein